MHKKISKHYKIIAFILCIVIVFTTVFVTKPFIPVAYAVWGVEDIVTDFWVGAESTIDAIATVAGWAWEYAKYALELLKGPIIVAAKIAALYAVQEAVAMITGDDSGGSSTLIRDVGNYLFEGPKQKAMAQMKSFFTSVSSGRISALSYEGFGTGKNYDAYMAKQAQKAINMGGTEFKTTIRNVVSDPQSDLFSSGNMKGLNEYLKCPNNVACYTQTAEKQYLKAVNQAQQIAKEESVDGFLPIKDILTGRIKTPADLAKNALMQVDSQGQELIMSAAADEGASLSGSLTQIAAGAALSIAARAINYGITDKEGDQIASSIKSGDGAFTLSTDYSKLGTSATSTTSEATYTAAQLAKTCSSLNLDVDPLDQASGGGTTIKGNWVQCKQKWPFP